MALELRQNFVSVQYLENKWTEFHQILYMHSYCQDLSCYCYTSFFAHLYQSYGPWYTQYYIPKFRFRTISSEQMDRFWPNLIYEIYIWIVSCHFSQICKLWPLIEIRITLPLNILRDSGLLLHARHCSGAIIRFSDNSSFISAHYLENKLIEFYQILYMHLYWQDLGGDFFTSFFAHLYQSSGPWYTSEFLFCSISWKIIGRISSNFIHAFILTRSMLGLLPVSFCLFVTDMALDLCQNFCFCSDNIFRTNGQNFT